jgi:hypothetical protein
MNQTFVLHGRPQWDRLVAFVKANVGGEKLLGITVFDADEKKRSDAQNRFYWKCRMEFLADNAWINGQRFSKEAWHEYLAERFCPKRELTLPNGEIKLVRESTSDMRVAEFQAYMQQIEVYATSELGLVFEE